MGTSFRLSADSEKRLQGIALAISGSQNTKWGFAEYPVDKKESLLQHQPLPANNSKPASMLAFVFVNGL